MRGHAAILRAAAVGCAALLAAAALSGCGSGNAGHRASGQAPTTMQVSVSQCGQGWSHPHAGQQQIVLHNTDSRSGEVYLTNADNGAVYTETDDLGPGTSTTIQLNLGSGRYALRCAMEDEATITGPTVVIGGNAKGTVVGVAPVTQAELIADTQAYQNYVKSRLPTLITQVQALQQRIDAGDLSAARTAWLPAHLTYERLGAAYDAFGDLDATINGLPNGLPGGVDDAHWTGFHRIEYGLWHGAPASTLRGPAATLSKAVQQLRAQFATAQIDPLDISIRAHEITENTVQFELTGETDFGSHSNLATASANLDGTKAVLAIIRPLLAPRYHQLPQLDQQLSQAAADLAAQDRSGHWTALDALSRPQRERLNAEFSELAETLAPIASILEPRRASQ